MTRILGVCGDSYMAATINGDRSDLYDSEGRHFTEILAKKIGYEYFTLARNACTNSCIRFQIDEMIKQKVDFVLVGTTRADRLDYPAKYNDSAFDQNLGIYNYVYETHPDKSAQNQKFIHNNMFSETLGSILSDEYGYKDVRDTIQRSSIRNYFTDIFDYRFREIQDSWIISDGLRELQEAKIPYIAFVHEYMTHVSYFNKKDNRHLIQNISGYNHLIPFCYHPNNTTRRYHTTDDDQIKIAEFIFGYLAENNLI